MRGLVLAGGYGTRLRPLTFSGNKHMLPVANQPILYYSLRHLAHAGVRNVGIVLGPMQEGIRSNVLDGKAFGLEVEYIEQGAPRGLAHAVACAREFLEDESFVMYLGDNLLQEGVSGFLSDFRAQSPDAVIGVTPVPNPGAFGVVELDDGRIASIEEKPAQPKSDLALIGVYLFSPGIHAIIDGLSPSPRGELEITEAIWKLHERGGDVRVRRVRGWWKDTGRPEDLLDANELVLRTTPTEEFVWGSPSRRTPAIHGNVSTGQGTVVESDVKIDGPVIVGEGSFIGGGSEIGPFTAIGNGVVLRGSSVSRSIVLDGARISGRFRLHNSLVGRNVEISAVGENDSMSCFVLGDAARLRI